MTVFVLDREEFGRLQTFIRNVQKRVNCLKIGYLVLIADDNREKAGAYVKYHDDSYCEKRAYLRGAIVPRAIEGYCKHEIVSIDSSILQMVRGNLPRDARIDLGQMSLRLGRDNA